MNLEETSRYIDPSQCHYLIDSTGHHASQEEPDYAKMTDVWNIASTHKMLDLSNSPIIIRSFYIPYFSETQNSYVNFTLLRNNNLFVNDNTMNIK